MIACQMSKALLASAAFWNAMNPLIVRLVILLDILLSEVTISHVYCGALLPEKPQLA